MIDSSTDDEDFTKESNQDYRKYKNSLKNSKNQTTQGFENYFTSFHWRIKYMKIKYNNHSNSLQFKALGTNIIKKIAFPGKGEKMVRDYDSKKLESQNYSNIIITKYYIPINLTNKD